MKSLWNEFLMNDFKPQFQDIKAEMVNQQALLEAIKTKQDEFDTNIDKFVSNVFEPHIQDINAKIDHLIKNLEIFNSEINDKIASIPKVQDITNAIKDLDPNLVGRFDQKSNEILSELETKMEEVRKSAEDGNSAQIRSTKVPEKMEAHDTESEKS